MALQTGHGTTISGATTGQTANVVSIEPFEISRPSLDVSHLETTGYREKIPGDLADPGGFTVTVLYDGSVHAGATFPAITDVAEVWTLDYGSHKYAASGFLTNYTSPTVNTDEVSTCTFTIQWADGPTFGV